MRGVPGGGVVVDSEPFAYNLFGLDDHVGTYRTLRAVVDAGRARALNWVALGWVRIEAVFPNGARDVPREAYQRPDPPSREEALAFIRARAAKIAASPDPENSFYRAMGCGRCLATDPEEKQVADYLASAPLVWRDDPDGDWWRVSSGAGGGSVA